MIDIDDLVGQPVSRRQLLGITAQLAVALPLIRAGLESATPPSPVVTPSRLGATISSRQANFLGLDLHELFEAVLSVGFDPIRIIADWAAVERPDGTLDLADVEWQLNRARAAGRPIIIAYGAKTPRYPEFNVPDRVLAGLDARDPGDREEYLLEQTLLYNAEIMRLAGDDPTIEFLQPGNEDLEPSEVTQWRSLSYDFVRSTIQHARNHSRLPILLTSSMPLIFADFLFRALRGHLYDAIRYIELADAVGYNTHTRIRNKVFGATKDFGPGAHYWPYLGWLRDRTWSAGKRAIIGEVQAEPFDYTVGGDRWGLVSNITPADTRALDDRVHRMGFGLRLVWGVEYAYWRWKQGERQYWEGLTAMVAANATA